MIENNIFEPDCNDCSGNEYDYSRLNSRYEADVERDEIIEWNKDACNAQYRGLEMIAEQLNFKEMQLEGCRKGYEKLMVENKTLTEENEQLKKELDSFEQVNFTDMCDGSRTVLYMKKENGDY